MITMTTTTRRLLVLSLCLCCCGAAAGCGSAAQAPAGADVSDDGGASVPVPSSYDAGAVAAAGAACSAPHGPAELGSSTFRQARARVAGSWLLCAGDDGMQTMFAPGISLLPDGTAYRLVSDGAGGLVRAQDVQGEDKWSVTCQAPTFPAADDTPCDGTLILLVHDSAGDVDPGGCAGGALSFESSPTRAYVNDDIAEWCTGPWGKVFELWLVPL